MKFKYRAYRNLTSPNVAYGKMPLLQVRLKHGQKYIDLDCLVDSGAGDCLFSTDIADVLGIDLKAAETREYYGIGEIAVTGFVYPVLLNIKGFDEWITIDAGFINENEMPLLGQSGFFENYEIIFRSYQNRFEIKRMQKMRRRVTRKLSN